jgi:putative hemolysin
MTGIGFEVVAILLLIVASGVFALSRTAVVAARKSRLQEWAEEGDSKAKAALEIANQPNRFLSTVQMGITFVAILAGAIGGQSLTDGIAARIGAIPGMEHYSQTIALGVVVVGLTLFFVLMGQLFPKQLALSSPESIARFVAVPMRLLSAIAGPLVQFLNFCIDGVLRRLGSRPSNQPPVTEEEIKSLIEQGTAAGVFEASEQDMMEAVIDLGDKSARALMTPRTQIVWFDLNDAPEQVRRKVADSGHSRFPVCRGSLDDVAGVAQTKDLLSSALAGKAIDLSASLQQPAFVPRSMTALQVLEHIKRSGSHIVLVVDEYGGIEGLLTHHDVLEAIAGEMPFGKSPVQSMARGCWMECWPWKSSRNYSI